MALTTGSRIKRLMPLTAAACALLCWPAWASGPDAPRDFFISRANPDIKDEPFETGTLGVLLTSYGRADLYSAYRAIAIGPQKAAATQFPRANRDEPNDEQAIRAWMEERASIDASPPRRRPQVYRGFGRGMFGGYVNCPAGAYVFAKGQLAKLKSRPGIKPSELRDWVSAQDTVFGYCSYVPGESPGAGGDSEPAPLMPVALPPGAPAYLRQLRAYQIAAAQFYAGESAEARRQFEAISRERGHPLRDWAAHSALRALAREGALDQAYLQRLAELRGGNLAADDKLQQSLALVHAERARKLEILEQLEARAGQARDTAEFKAIQAANAKLLRRATIMLSPERAWRKLSEDLNDLEGQPNQEQALGQWAQMADYFLDLPRMVGSPPDLEMRNHYVWFDWIRTVQGCTDNPASNNFGGHCALEHEHALARWTEKKESVWLVATMMTASKLTPQLRDAVDAALLTPPEALEYLTLRYYAIRLLREAGQRDKARELIEATLSTRLPSISAINLLRQEHTALSVSPSEAMPWLLRDVAGYMDRDTGRTAFANNVPARLAADGDELLNRQLSSEELLTLAENSSTPASLRGQLAVAVWWRGDLTDNAALAERGARLAVTLVPSLRDDANHYMQAGSAADKRYSLVVSSLRFSLSPVVSRYRANEFARPRRGATANWWCSFKSESLEPLRNIERTPPLRPMSGDARARDAELTKLRAIEASPGWFARFVIARAKSNPADPLIKPLLMTISRSNQGDCAAPDSDALEREAQRLLQGRA